MAQHSKDIVLAMTFGEMDETDRRLLDRLLRTMEGVTAFQIVGDRLIISLSSHEGEVGLMRSFAAAGIYPLSAKELGATDTGGPRAC